jgi:hypothetical protein
MRTHAVLALVRTRVANAFLLSLLAGGALLGDAAPAGAQGRVTFSQMSIERCKGTCMMKLSCSVGGKPASELLSGQKARTKDLVDIGKSLEVPQFPAEVKCTASKDTGWIGTTWTAVGSGTAKVPAGGDFKIDIDGADTSVRVLLTVDSLEIFLPAGPPPAAPAAAKGKKPAAKTAATPLLVSATFNPAKEGHAVVIGMEYPAFKDKIDKMSANGMKLVAFKTFDDGGKHLWAGIFKSVSDRVILRANQTWDEFLAQWKQMTGGRARLVDMDIYGEGPKPQFAGLYRDYSPPEGHVIWVGQTRKEMQDKVKELQSFKDLQIVDVVPYHTNGKLYYAGAFRHTTGKYDFWTGLDRAAFDGKWKNGANKDQQLVELVTFKDGGKRIYDGIVRSGMGEPGEVVLDADMATFVKHWLDDTGKGQRVTSLDFYHD